MAPSDSSTESLDRILNTYALKDLRNLPPMPQSASTALQLARKRPLELEEIVVYALTDPLLSARLLSVANSTRFRGATQLNTITAAATRMGTTGCRELLLQYACLRMLSSHRPPYATVLGKVFDRSVRSAQVTHRVADHFFVESDVAYLAALMQDLGYARCVQTLAQHLKTPPTEADMIEAIEPVHGEVGAHLIKAWNLPADFAEVCEHHHAPGQRKLPLMVNIANQVVAVCEGDKILAGELTYGLRELGFTAKQVAALFSEAARELQWVA